MLSVLNLMILRLGVDSVEDFADFRSAGANPADFTKNFHKENSKPLATGHETPGGKTHLLTLGPMASCILQ